MPWFKIYCGMGGSFGGARYNGTYEYANIDEATRDAYRMAEEEYQSYEGSHGILSYDDCLEDLHDSGWIDDDMTDAEIEDMAANHYLEQIESWISYYVLPATGPEDKDDEDS